MDPDSRNLEEGFEINIIENPYKLENWLYYIEFKSKSPKDELFLLYNRALHNLPRSYKLWMSFLKENIKLTKEKCISDPIYEEVNSTFEKCLLHLYKMPVIWNMYLQFLLPQRLITKTRLTFDRALRTLPITQHIKFIWPLYIEFANTCGVPETCARIWRRYVKVAPGERESHVDALLQGNAYDAAVQQLVNIINDNSFQSTRGKSKYEMWVDLLKLFLEHDQDITCVDVENVIRSGINKYPHEVARMWLALAEIHMSRGHAETCRSVYEEAIRNVLTVRDVTAVYDAYYKFEFSLTHTIAKRHELLSSEVTRRQGGGEENSETQTDSKKLTDNDDDSDSDSDSDSDDEDEVDQYIRNLTDAELMEELADTTTSFGMQENRVEMLSSRRLWIINDTILRLNPNVVSEWERRVELCGNNDMKKIEVYNAALDAIDNKEYIGRLDRLYYNFAMLYLKYDQLDDTRNIFDKGVLVNFKKPQHLVELCCKYVETELMHGNLNESLELLRRFLNHPLLHKNIQLWCLYADIIESTETVDATVEVYDKMINLNIITPQLLLNYIAILTQDNRYNAVFRIFERGVAKFTYPMASPLWLSYIKTFVMYYAGRNIERTRDLFVQAIKVAPIEFRKPLYLLYVVHEEKYGMPNNIMRILNEAVDNVPPNEKIDLYYIYIAKSLEYFGFPKTRDVLNKALETIPSANIADIGIKYAYLERKQCDFDRARSIYQHVSQYCNPFNNTHFWNVYYAFESNHGNEDSFKDMLRLKNTVEAKYSASAIRRPDEEMTDEEKLLQFKQELSNSNTDGIEGVVKREEREIKQKLE